LFQEIVRLHLALARSDIEEFLRRCQIYGYQISQSGSASVCTGPDIELRIQAFDADRPPTRSGLMAVEFQLRKSKTGQKVFQLGTNSLLEFKDRTAIWHF
jgi:hypothetical protein